MFDWDDANIDHIARHGLEPYEVEEALLDPDLLTVTAHKATTERRFAIIGASEAGRILFVVYTLRGDDIRPVTAREANATQKRRYRKEQKQL